MMTPETKYAKLAKGDWQVKRVKFTFATKKELIEYLKKKYPGAKEKDIKFIVKVGAK